MAMASSIKLTYSRRLFYWLLIYSLLLVGCFIVYQYAREKQFKVSELNSRLQQINSYIGREMAAGVPIDSVRLDLLHADKDIRVTLIDGSGHVIYDNSLDSLPEGNHLGREEIARAREKGEGYATRRHSESTGGNYFYSATRMPDGMIVRSAVPYSTSLLHLLEADYTFLWIMGGVAVIFCVIGYFATRRVGLHIVRLKDFAEKAESGATISDTAPFPHDELGDISNNIVRLYARLQQAIADRDLQHSMAMHQQHEKERIKKQLTNNINHELKTPVASIQVCLETMLAHENMDPAKRRDFLERCLANTDRLRRLLADVALLTRMDDGGRMIALEPVDLSAVAASVVADCMPSAEERGMTVIDTLPAGLRITGNVRLLESVFYNLIDNALAYSGGSRIVIDGARTADGLVTVTVSDNGCGVADEHLERIFERFYRVDKGRSRAMGGTGLGLSIVRNAIRLQGGTIRVSNLPSGGLSFTISVPAAS